MPARETPFERLFVADLKKLFPGCVITKGNSAYRQGIPDRFIYWGKHWAAFEVKAAPNSSRQPNQPYYVELLNEMSFAAFVYPENREEVIRGLQQAFGA